MISTPYLLDKFVQHIDLAQIQTIFQLGAHDASDTVDVVQFYKPQKMIVLECNPLLLELCQKTIDQCRQNTGINIEFVGKAAHKFPGNLKYFTVTGNNISEMENSSVYKHHYVPMTEIVVPATSLDHECETRGIQSIDLICADIEGGEVNAFTKQNILNKTKYIITEIGLDPNWKPGYPTLKDLEPVLKEYGFELTVLDEVHKGLAGDALFTNRRWIDSTNTTNT